MCVRELRSSEAPNVIVFYLAFISSLGALTGVIGQVPRLTVLADDTLQITGVGRWHWSHNICRCHKLMLRFQAEGRAAWRTP